MTPHSRPLSASMRPEPLGALVTTANTTAKITTGDLSATAAELLHRAATLALAISNEHSDPAIAAAITQAMALAGTGYAQLAALDFAQEQANRQAALFGEVLAEFRAIVAGAQPVPADEQPADFLLDKTDDRWTHTGNGLYESTQDSGLYDMPIETIRDQWGPVREYVLRPPRPGS